MAKIKDPVSGLTHLGGCIASIIGLVVLILLSRYDIPKLVTMIIYGSSLILLYGASATYHMLNTSPKKTTILRKFDHISIFILIAGCYTPVFYNVLNGGWRIGMLLAVWITALVGIIFKAIYIKGPRYLSSIIYLAMGWIAIIPIVQLATFLSIQALILMIGGGILYTLGAIIYATKVLDFIPGKFGFHEVFHIFVMLGSLVHFFMMVKYILPFNRI